MSRDAEPALGKTGPEMVDPAALLQAAETAPRRFNITGYFPALRVMREKGYSWRQLDDWVRGFNIAISHVHLRRLYVQESARRGLKGGGQRSSSPGASIKRRPAPITKPAPMPRLPDPVPEVVGSSFQDENLLRYEGLT